MVYGTHVGEGESHVRNIIMPTKGSITSNVFENLEDLAKSTTKQAASAVAKPLNPVKIIQEIVKPGGQADKGVEKLNEQAKKDNSTPLDFDKLNEKYKENDTKKLAAVRKQFQYVKGEEQQAIEARKREEQERQRRIEQEEQEKKRKEQERKQAESAAPIPAGKQRRNLFSPKKKAQQQHQETKPSVGKQ